MRIFILILLVFIPTTAFADPYEKDIQAIEEMKPVDGVSDEVLMPFIEALFDEWMGTPWGLGAPQTETPQEGKVNCGTFVGRILKDAGFNLSVKKLQRQPSELIVKSLAPKDKIRRYRHESIEDFVKDVKTMGPGLYIVGLDYHVGFVVVRPDLDVRFVHADLYNKKVVDEPALESLALTHSNYRVIGKTLQPSLLEKWASGRRIPIRGNW